MNNFLKALLTYNHQNLKSDINFAYVNEKVGELLLKG